MVIIMINKILFFSFLISSNAVAQDGAPVNGFASFLPIVLIMVVFYLLIIHPQRKQVKEHTAMINALKQNDKIVSASGIYGKVIKVNETEETVNIEIAENVVITMKKTSVSEVINKNAKPANDDGTKKVRPPRKKSS